MDLDLIQKLVIFCHQIAKEGKQPSVALLRAKAPMKVSVTNAIEAMKRYNASHKMPVEGEQPASEVDRIALLEKRVTQLENALTVMEQRLNKLTQD